MRDVTKEDRLDFVAYCVDIYLGVELLGPSLVEVTDGTVRQYIRYGLNQNRGRPVRLSPNKWMFRNVKVIQQP